MPNERFGALAPPWQAVFGQGWVRHPLRMSGRVGVFLREQSYALAVRRLEPDEPAGANRGSIMAKPTHRSDLKSANGHDQNVAQGNGGELHQVAGAETPSLTTALGTPVSDDQNTLRIGERGPSLIEDFHFREKIFHFDHERIPERVVHAEAMARMAILRLMSRSPNTHEPTSSSVPAKRRRPSCAFRRLPGTKAHSISLATCAALPSNSIPRKAIGI
jgi:hypothetical protein